MSTQLSSREKLLATIVGVAVVLFLSAFVVDYFLKNQSRLRNELARNTAAVAAMRRSLSERAIWEERDAWITANQPKLTVSDDVAGGQLLNSVKEVAKKNSVQINSQSLRLPANVPEGHSISVDMEVTSTWPSLIGFMRELQAPEQFVVFETAALKVDEKDATQMRGNFRVAKWFAPRGGAIP